MRSRVALIGIVLGALAMSLGACGGSGTGSGSALTQAQLSKLDIYDIDQIERKWHDAETHRNLAEMMSLWAPKAVWEADQDLTLVGKDQIRNFWVTQVFPAAKAQHWFSDTASFRMRTTVDGDKGTLYFECHELDSKTQKLLAVVGQELDVARMGRHWLITKSVGSSPTL